MPLPTYDLNLVPSSPGAVKSLVKSSFELQFKTLAITETQAGRVSSHKARAYHSDDQRVFHRLTLTLTEIADSYSLSSSFTGLNEYDILAAKPVTDKMFGQAVDKLECDIITFDFGRRQPFRIKPAQIRQAVARGIMFELCYGDLIAGDSMARRNCISNAQAIVRVTKGKHVILSSGLEDGRCLRSPHDVANLARLFGLSADQAWAALTTTPRHVVEHARMRRDSHRGVVAIRRCAELSTTKAWRMPVDLTHAKLKASSQPSDLGEALSSSMDDRNKDDEHEGQDQDDKDDMDDADDIPVPDTTSERQAKRQAKVVKSIEKLKPKKKRKKQRDNRRLK
eukprot:TRINITY_DN8594_c0_g1_i3.p1 TRINITY_DN8594_c0_g1~~TRINITY_DN8594_c0_g1_i3.p1  ORF type:complete len:338 (+),score=73.98 TRINITY_DN8594_c0_g1_i3:71-1084(+)